jgi:hypothetical protein
MKLPNVPVAALALSLAAIATLGSALAVPAAAHGLFDRPKSSLEVVGNEPLDLAGLGPGSRPVVRVVGLHATGALTYRLRSDWSGSAALARTLELTMTDSKGRLMYQGPFDGARVGGTGWETGLDLHLTDGQAESITMAFSLPLSAGNDVQGAELSAQVLVEATESVA